MNYLNINWLLSRLLERIGIKTYLEKVEFAAHLFAGCTFGLLGVLIPYGFIIVLLWSVWVFVDEFVFDGWKGKDTLIDLSSKLAGSFGYLIWILI